MSLRVWALLAAASAAASASTIPHAYSHSNLHAVRADDDVKVEPAGELAKYYARDSSLDGVKWIGGDDEWFGSTTLPEVPGETPTPNSLAMAQTDASLKSEGSLETADDSVHECFMPVKDEEGHLQLGCAPGAVKELTEIFEAHFNESSLDERSLSEGDLDARGLGKIFASVVRAVGLNPTISNGLVSIYESVATMFGADVAAGETAMLVSEEMLVAAGVELSLLGPAALALIGGYAGVSLLMSLWNFYGEHKIVPDIMKVHKDGISIKKGAAHPGDASEEDKEDQRTCGLQISFPEDFPACIWEECNGDSKGDKKCRDSEKYPSCTCLPEGLTVIDESPGWELPDFSDLPDEPEEPEEPEPEPGAEPECTNQDNTYIWTDQFMGDSNLFDTFCNELDESTSSERTEELEYGKVKFAYESTSDDSCSYSCTDAFSKIGEKCHENETLDVSAQIDAKCGKYSYEIEMFAPEAECTSWWGLVLRRYRINWIRHWTYPDRWQDPGKDFEHMIHRCGATTNYSWKDNDDGTSEIHFTLPLFSQDCVSGVIKSAGGPSIGC